MNTKIILTILLALSLIFNGFLIFNNSDESFDNTDVIITDIEGYPKPQINIECNDNKDCYNKEESMGIYCGWGHTIGCGSDNFCECIEITRG